MKKLRKIKIDFWFVSTIALLYYSVLASFNWSWIFASGDSGDWLASSIWWMNSQPFGSPLYVLLGHGVNALFPQNLVSMMTYILSVIPASITVGMVFLIARKLTNDLKLSLLASFILLGSVIFLGQATVLEEYAIATMFMTFGFWFYINDRKKLTVLFLGLATAIHIIPFFISLIWLCLHLKEIKHWLKTFPIFITVGVLPYLLVPLLMYLDTPKLLAGHLSLSSFNSYLGSSSTIGSISWYEFLFRVPQFIGIVGLSLGFALVPLLFGLKKPFSKPIVVMISTIMFSVWLYATNTDPSTYTFMCFTFPLIAVLSVIGLQSLKPIHTKLVAGGSICLILVNGIFLNAGIITTQYPVAQQFEQDVKSLPDGSAIVTCSGGSYGLGTIYLMAEGKDIFPIYYTGQQPDTGIYTSMVDSQLKTVYWKDARYQAYKEWLSNKYSLRGDNTQAMVKDLLSQGRNVYLLLLTVTPYWQNVFRTEQVFNPMPTDKFYDKVDVINQNLEKITGVN